MIILNSENHEFGLCRIREGYRLKTWICASQDTGKDDGGHGYGFDDSDSREKLYPHRKENLAYWYTSTTDGGSDWSDGHINNIVELIPIEELEDGEAETIIS